MYALPTCMSMYMCAWYSRSQKRTLDSPGTRVKDMVVSCHLCAGNEPGFTAKAASVFNPSAINHSSPGLHSFIFLPAINFDKLKPLLSEPMT